LGIRCHEVLALVFSDDEPATIMAAEQLADAARVMDAAWVLTVFTTLPTPSAVRRCADVLAEAGVGMAVEFSPLGPVSTITKGMEVVHAASRGRGHARLLIDSWHFCFGDSTFDELAAVPLDDIAYVQFTDALEPLSDNLVRETLHRRAPPGECTPELDRFAATLLDRGWDGIVSVEVLNAELRELPVDFLARRLHDTTASFWR
jgi:sugar phosphate isomerase/epimerase